MDGYIKWIRERVGHDTIILNASCAIIEKDGKVLILRRGDRDTETWGLPGGFLEIGETAEGAMLREVKEEVGLDVAVKYFQGVYTKDRFDSYPNGDVAQVVLFVFVVEPVGGTLQADGNETAEVVYVDPREYPPTFRHKLIFEDYMAGKKGVVT
jgi:mutator protein MutT